MLFSPTFRWAPSKNYPLTVQPSSLSRYYFLTAEKLRS